MPEVKGELLIAMIAIVIIVVAVVAYFASTPPAEVKPVGKVSWSIGTCTAGSVGYVAHSATADIPEEGTSSLQPFRAPTCQFS
jgi:TRAP-type uncharacterized transport system substrate-binding protein